MMFQFVPAVRAFLVGAKDGGTVDAFHHQEISVGRQGRIPMVAAFVAAFAGALENALVTLHSALLYR